MSWITVCEFRELAVGMPVAVMVDGEYRWSSDRYAAHVTEWREFGENSMFASDPDTVALAVCLPDSAGVRRLSIDAINASTSGCVEFSRASVLELASALFAMARYL